MANFVPWYRQPKGKIILPTMDEMLMIIPLFLSEMRKNSHGYVQKANHIGIELRQNFVSGK